MWISFHEEGKWKRQSRRVPFAIRIYAGGINAISGEPMRPNMATFSKIDERGAKETGLPCVPETTLD